MKLSKLFKRTVWKRYWEDNHDRLYIEREYHPPWALLLGFVFPPFWFYWRYEVHESLDSEVFDIENKIAKRRNEIRDLIDDLENAKARREVDRREIKKKTNHARRGCSEPFKEKCGWLFGTYVEPKYPDESWREDFSPKFLHSKDPKKAMKESVKAKVKANKGKTSDSGPSSVVGVVLPQHKGIHFDGYDFVEAAGGNQNKRQQKGHHWKNQRKGESYDEWQDRIQSGNPDQDD